MPSINIVPIDMDNQTNDDEVMDTSFLDFNFKENENCYEASRKCLQLADTTIINNKRLIDENYKLRKTIYLMQKKIYQLNDLLHDAIYQKEANKFFLLPYFQSFLHLGEKDKKEKCPICLDLLLVISNEDITKTSCGHLFHGTCYYQNRSNLDEGQEDICSVCRQRHVPFDIGYVNSKKEWVEHTEQQTKSNLVKVLQISGTNNLPSSEEIICQIYRKIKTNKITYY